MVDMSGYYVPPAEEPPVSPDAGSPPVDSGPAGADAGSLARDSGAVEADVAVTPEPETDDAGSVDGAQSDARVEGGLSHPPAKVVPAQRISERRPGLPCFFCCSPVSAPAAASVLTTRLWRRRRLKGM